MNAISPSTTATPSADASGRRDVCVLLNAGSGKKKDAAVRQKIRAALDRYPGRFDLRILRRGRDIVRETDKAIDEGYPTIVAAGGDGTISAVASRVLAADRVLGVLPLGTFNYFARGLGLPEEIEAAVDVLMTGTPTAITVGEVNDQIFLNNASLGLYPAILQQREGTYRRWGRSRLAAHWSVLVTFLKFHRPLTLTATVDGVTHRTRTPLAFVARSAYQLEEFGLGGAEGVRHDRFALFLAPDGTRWSLLIFALRLAWRNMEEGRDFELYIGEDIVIDTARRRRLVARDGERARMKSPFRFRILKDALRVVMPPT